MRVPAPPAGVDRALAWAEVVPAGSYATKVLGRGTRLRLADPDGGACAHLLLFRADASWERLNVADTMKVPWQAYLGAGHPLLSDQGRVLATIVADTSGHHDALCGMTGAGRAQMLLGVHKHGMDVRDVAPVGVVLQGCPRRRRRRADVHRVGGRGNDGRPADPPARRGRRWSTPPTRSTPRPRSPISTWWPGAPTAS